MSRATRFLQSLSNLLAAASLYGPEHRANRSAFDQTWSSLEALLEEGPLVAFSFLEDEVVFGSEPLRELRTWSWSRRLADVGIQRLEIERGVSPAELRAFLAEAARRLELGAGPSDPGSHPHIRFGSVGVAVNDPSSRARAAEKAGPLSLLEESQAVAWINERASAGDVPTAEAAAVVRGLAVAMHDVRQLVAPLVQIKSTDQYTTAHCINVSILSMSLAEYLTFGDPEVRAIGEAALLHDVGKTRIPVDVLNKPGALTAEERAIIERHPVEGSRLLLGRKDRNALAATVAYEHHMHFSGSGGYPSRHYPRKPHRFSRLVQVCDVYDALRTRRPFRAPLSAEAALRFLEARAGTEFDPELVRAFASMMRQLDPPTIAAEEAAGDTIEAEDLASLPAGPYDADIEHDLFAG